MFKLFSSPLEHINLREGLTCDAAGAFVSFEGWVRDMNDDKRVVSLEYEAHEILCEQEAEKIFREARERFKIIELRCFHRVGRLNVGDMAVWVGVTAAHRQDAFGACQYIMSEVKKRLPIWKKEYYASGDSGWVNTQTNPTVVSEKEFYSRQIILPEITQAGQEQLKQAKILVVGAGGLGCSALTGLASAGVGTIGICEFDELQASNLHRQFLYSFSDIGKPKIELARERIQFLNPFITIQTHPLRLNAANAADIIRAYDVILDCTDNFSTKFLLNDACVIFNKPLIQASIYQYEGQIRALVPRQTACLRCLWATIPQENCVGNCADAGVIGSVAHILGSMQALEAIKTILNFAGDSTGDTIVLNCLNYQTIRLQQTRNADCPVCGCAPTITALSEANYTHLGLEIDLQSLSVDRIGQFQFIDIREPDETATDPVNEMSTMPWPLSRFAHASFSFEPDKQYIVFCAKGGRSLHLTKKFREQGLTNIYSLTGGLASIKKYFYQQRTGIKS